MEFTYTLIDARKSELYSYRGTFLLIYSDEEIKAAGKSKFGDQMRDFNRKQLDADFNGVILLRLNEYYTGQPHNPKPMSLKEIGNWLEKSGLKKWVNQ